MIAIISQELDFWIIAWLSRYKIGRSKIWNTWLITACNHYLTIFKGSHLLWTLIKCPLNLLKEGSIKFRLKIWIKITFTACICWPKLTVRLSESLTSGTSSRHCFVRGCEQVVLKWSNIVCHTPDTDDNNDWIADMKHWSYSKLFDLYPGH